MVHSGMNEPLITLCWVWGLGLKWVELEREGISSHFTVTSSEIQTSELPLAGEPGRVTPAILKSITEFVRKVLPKFFIAPSEYYIGKIKCVIIETLVLRTFLARKQFKQLKKKSSHLLTSANHKVIIIKLNFQSLVSLGITFF